MFCDTFTVAGAGGPCSLSVCLGPGSPQHVLCSADMLGRAGPAAARHLPAVRPCPGCRCHSSQGGVLRLLLALRRGCGCSGGGVFQAATFLPGLPAVQFFS